MTKTNSRKILSIVLCVILVLSTLLVLTSCGPQGTYYQYDTLTEKCKTNKSDPTIKLGAFKSFTLKIKHPKEGDFKIKGNYKYKVKNKEIEFIDVKGEKVKRKASIIVLKYKKAYRNGRKLDPKNSYLDKLTFNFVGTEFGRILDREAIVDGNFILQLPYVWSKKKK